MNRIKELRIELGWTQEELGKILNVKGAAISKYENELIPLTDDTIKKLSETFNVSSDYLLGRSDNRDMLSSKSGPALGEKYPDVHDVEEAMKIILEQPGLMLKGELLSDESKIILANAIQMGLRTAEELEKKKNKGDMNE
jgi:transcriptional regulator with XRE-family HTH domain